MSPEWTDICGIVHYYNESLGIEENEYGYATVCHFYPDDYREDVYMDWEGTYHDGMHGLHIGWMDGIPYTMGGKQYEGVRYECVLWDNGEMSWIHASRLK